MQSKEEQKEYNKQYHTKNKKKSHKYYISIKPRRKKYLADNKEHTKKMVRNCNLKREFNITEEQYNELFDKQNGYCAICGTHQKDLKTRLAVDHNHVTKKIRGLLCLKCNRGIGFLNDDIKILEKAITYLNT